MVTNEHLTEALRRLRKNASSDNVDRRLVTNILLSFLTTSRADSKRFEMLSLLSTILGWDDTEREKAGLQRSSNAPKPSRRKSSVQGERSAEEEAAMNEVSDRNDNTLTSVLLQPLCRVSSQRGFARARRFSSLDDISTATTTLARLLSAIKRNHNPSSTSTDDELFLLCQWRVT